MNGRVDGPGDPLPPREAILVETGWRLAHAFNSTLPGWLVAVPRRHVTAMDELTPIESAALGLILQRASVALREVTGCEKTYVMLFAEQEGFAHLHVHLVPRMAWFGPDETGPRVFNLLAADEAGGLPEAERDEVALALQAALVG